MATATIRQAARVLGSGELIDLGARFYLVSSQSSEHGVHVVRWSEALSGWRCDCAGFGYRGRCAHVQVVCEHTIREAHAAVTRAQATLRTINAPATRDAEGAAERDRWEYENMGGALIDCMRGW